MTQIVVMAGYEGQSMWMFVRGLLLTWKLIITFCVECTDCGKNWSWNLAIWGHGAYIL